jgi:hypothetical protein
MITYAGRFASDPWSPDFVDALRDGYELTNEELEVVAKHSTLLAVYVHYVTWSHASTIIDKGLARGALLDIILGILEDEGHPRHYAWGYAVQRRPPTITAPQATPAQAGRLCRIYVRLRAATLN